MNDLRVRTLGYGFFTTSLGYAKPKFFYGDSVEKLIHEYNLQKRFYTTSPCFTPGDEKEKIIDKSPITVNLALFINRGYNEDR